MPANDMKWSDARRVLAVELHEKGRELEDIMDILEASRTSVYEWLKRAREDGVESLVRTYKPRELKFSTEHHEPLMNLIDQGAQAHGYEDERWTQARVQKLIQDHFSVDLHLSSVARILHELGYSWQKPTTREPRRDEDAVRTWVQQTWPELEKKS